MLAQQSRLILAHATPMLIAQLSSIGMMIIDTALLGHYGATDLAAVAVGGGIYISVVFALAGILQAVAPTVAHLHGGGRAGEIAGALQQAFWLALLLAVLGEALQVAGLDSPPDTREELVRFLDGPLQRALIG